MVKQTQSLGLVALGANLPTWAGIPSDSLRRALLLFATENIDIISVSRFWKTPAFPIGSGPDYVNAAACVRTDLTADALLEHLHGIEAELGRIRDGGRWQARPLDLDLLAYDDQVLPDARIQTRWRDLPPDRQAVEAPDQLILPHPRMQDRAFVLVPLAEIAPRWRHPLTGLTVTQMRDALPPAAFAGMELAEP